MVTRRIDLESSLRRARKPGAGSPATALRDNEISTDSLPEVASISASSPDPSPFSRADSTDTTSSRAARIAVAAYHRAQHRGFAPGQELEDWLAAEREIDAYET